MVWQDVQQVKVLAAKPEDLSSIPWIHIVDPADCPLAFTYAPWSVCAHAWIYIHTCLHKIMDRLPSLRIVREMTGQLVITLRPDLCVDGDVCKASA